MAETDRAPRVLQRTLLLLVFFGLLLAVASTMLGKEGPKIPDSISVAQTDFDPTVKGGSPLIDDRSPVIGGNNEERDFAQIQADENFARNIKNFSLFVFFGGPFLYLVVPVALFIALLSAILLGRRQAAAKSRSADLSRFGVSLATVIFLYWTALSCFQGRLLWRDPMFASRIGSESVSLLRAMSPPLPEGFIRTTKEWLAKKSDLEETEDLQSQASPKKGRAFPWPLALALGALLVAAGKYLDDYLVSKEVKSRIRDLLIAAFLFIDKPSIPKFEKPLLNAFGWTWARLRFWTVPLLLASAYWIFVTFVYLTRRVIVGPTDRSYWKYLIFWSFDSPGWLLYTLWALTTVLGSIAILALFLRWAERRQFLPSRLSLVLFGVAASLAFVFNGYIGLLFFFPIAIPYGVIIPFGAIVLSSLPALSTGLLILALILIRTLIAAMRAILLHVFDKASDPKVSPFTYATTILSFIILGLKVVSEWK